MLSVLISSVSVEHGHIPLHILRGMHSDDQVNSSLLVGSIVRYDFYTRSVTPMDRAHVSSSHSVVYMCTIQISYKTQYDTTPDSRLTVAMDAVLTFRALWAFRLCWWFFRYPSSRGALLAQTPCY